VEDAHPGTPGGGLAGAGMAIDDERAAYVTLALTPGIGAVRLAALLSHFESARGALQAPHALLCTTPGITRAAATAIAATSLATGRRVLDSIEASGALCLTPTDPGFPPVLAEIPDPPTLLFAKGNLALLDCPGVAVVGSRDHSEYGAEIAWQVAAAAAEAGLTVISGMARGLDAVAHTAALEASGGTIGVLGNGLGIVYPAANRALYARVAESGLLLTEFPPGDRPAVGAFPRRNRLISGLARVTVVVEAAEGSGTLITVGTALAQGREVMAVPGNITSRTSLGTNQLIRDGAEPLLEVSDLLRHYPEVGGGVPRALRPETVPPGLSAVEQRLWLRLREGPARLDSLITVLGAPAAEVLAAASGLELRGLAGMDDGILKRISDAGARI
jgi:DNA processing protein